MKNAVFPFAALIAGIQDMRKEQVRELIRDCYILAEGSELGMLSSGHEKTMGD